MILLFFQKRESLNWRVLVFIFHFTIFSLKNTLIFRGKWSFPNPGVGKGLMDLQKQGKGRFLPNSALVFLKVQGYNPFMKRFILAPLLSAFILPGLGQVINGQIRKAGLLIAAVSLLFLALFFKVLYDLNKIFLSLPLEEPGKSSPNLPEVAQALSGQDKTVLIVLLLLLSGVWIYGVWDAFRVARKVEAEKS